MRSHHHFSDFNPLVVEELEPRILYSADLQPLIAAAVQMPLSSGQTNQVTASMVVEVGPQQVQQRHEIVFIDSAVSDYQNMAKEIRNDSAAGVEREVIIIDAGTNGVEQISAALAQHKNIDAVHIIAHGDAGLLQLGASRLDDEGLLANAVAISHWGDALSSDADILLYGCDVAATQAGQAFVSNLGYLTGADINASADLTGNALKGGNWVLEYRTGQIDTAIAPNYAIQANWSGVLTTYTVTITDDSGAGTLRQAILDANDHAGTDTIVFNITSGSPGVKTIKPTSQLPGIAEAVTIDGTTQTGWSTSSPMIELSGELLGGFTSGLGLIGDGVTIKGLVINRFYYGLLIGSNNNTITGNFIGTNATGTTDFGNQTGIALTSSTGNIIGGMSAADRNVISGNSDYGIFFGVNSSATIQGNYIGTNAAGTGALANGTGISVAVASSSATIGGTATGAGNVISGNTNDGIRINYGSATITGNYIGTNAAGTSALANGASGIYLAGGSATIGGTAAGAGNVISGNGTYGIFGYSSSNITVQGNAIGTTANGQNNLGNTSDGILLESSSTGNVIGGTTDGAGNIIAHNGGAGIFLKEMAIVPDPGGNQILRNSIFGNAGLGIALGTSRTTFLANDTGVRDVDAGANGRQNFPLLTSVTHSGTNALISGYLDSQANQDYRIEFFANRTGSTSTYGQGERYLGFTTVTTNGHGIASFGVSFAVTGGEWISATATDQTTDGTSEFSQDVLLANAAPSGTNTTVTTLEDTAYTFTAADFGFTDTDNNNFLSVEITTLPSAGTLKFNGETVSAGYFVSKDDIDRHRLVFTPAANANGTGYSSFTFRVKDDGGTIGSGEDMDASANTMTVNVTAVNDVPSGTNNTVTTLEDTAYTFSAADFGFTDTDGNSLLSVKITTLPSVGTLKNNGVTVTAGSFVSKGDIDLGYLVFTPAANANGVGYGSFTFQVNDDGGTANGGIDMDASANTMTVNVTAVNDAPAGASATVTMLEDTAYTFSAADFGFTDVDGNNFLSVKMTTLPGAGTIRNNGAAVSAGDFITKSDIDLGRLVFTPATNANGVGYSSFTFQVNDDGGTANGGIDTDASANTMTVNVTAVNDAPAGTNNTVTTSEDTAYTFSAADFGFTDVDGGNLLFVKITTLSSAGTLKNNGATVTAGSFVSLEDINRGHLVFTPVVNANGVDYSRFTFQVKDDGGTANGGIDTDASANTMTIDVTAVNDAPVIASNGGEATATTTMAENTKAITTVTATDVDVGTTFTYSIAGGADAEKFVIDSATGALTFASAPNYEHPTDANADNVYDVVVQVSDGDLTDTQAISVAVTDVNEAPLITSATTVSVSENTTAVMTVTASDVDAGTTLTYSITGGADAAKFVIDRSTGVLSFASMPDFEIPTDAGADSTYDVTVQVSDGKLTSTQAIAVTLTDVNDNTPVITSNAGEAATSISVAENTTAVTTVSATDADTDTTLIYSIIGGADAANFTIDSATGTLTFAKAPDYENPRGGGAGNVYDVVVQVSDGISTKTQSIAVTVTDVNDSTPVVTPAGNTASTATDTGSTTDNSSGTTNPFESNQNSGSPHQDDQGRQQQTTVAQATTTTSAYQNLIESDTNSSTHDDSHSTSSTTDPTADSKHPSTHDSEPRRRPLETASRESGAPSASPDSSVADTAGNSTATLGANGVQQSVMNQSVAMLNARINKEAVSIKLLLKQSLTSQYDMNDRSSHKWLNADDATSSYTMSKQAWQAVAVATYTAGMVGIISKASTVGTSMATTASTALQLIMYDPVAICPLGGGVGGGAIGPIGGAPSGGSILPTNSDLAEQVFDNAGRFDSLDSEGPHLLDTDVD